MNHFDLIGKRINLIKLHDFLDQIDTHKPHSEMHDDSTEILEAFKKKKKILYKGKSFTETEFKDALLEEVVGIYAFCLNKGTQGYEATITFETNNRFRIPLKHQEQFAQIYQYLLDVPNITK